MRLLASNNLSEFIKPAKNIIVLGSKYSSKATTGYTIPHWQNVLIDLLNNAVRYDINNNQLTIYKSDNWIGKLSRL